MNRAPQFITAAFLFLYALALVFFFVPGAIICLTGSISLLIINRSKKEKPVRPAAVPSTNVRLSPAAIPSADIVPVGLQPPAPELRREESFHVAGITFYESAFMALATPNHLYDWNKRDLVDSDFTCERIFEYTYAVQNIALVEEPTNVYDPNAIKVIADGHHVGYIKKGSTSRIRNIIKAGIISIKAEAGGGKYKYIDEDGHMECVTAPHFMHLTIRFNGGKNGNR